MSLATLDEVKTFLGIPLGDTSKDSIITTFKDATEASIIAYCETDFASHVVTNEIIDGTQSDVIITRFFPIISIQSIFVGIGRDLSGGKELTTDDYLLRDGSITLKDFSTPYRRGAVKVNYTYGYSSVPADVKLALYQTVKAEMQRFDRNTEDVMSRSKGDESESFGGAWDGKSGLPKQVVSKLAHYRVIECPNIPMSQRNY